MHSSSTARLATPRHVCIAHVASRTHFCGRQFFCLVHQLSWVRVGCACACSPRVSLRSGAIICNSFLWKTIFFCLVHLSSTRGGAVGGSAPRLYQETDQIWSGCIPFVFLAKFPLLSRPLVFPIPATACMAVRESRPPKPHPLRSCTGRRAIRFLGSVSARLLASIRVLPR
jgi:hypothetical protein